jgi:hypothetical protein
MSSWNQGGTNRLGVNLDALERALLMVFVVRVFVLKKLVDRIPRFTDAFTARRRWVLLQAMPPYFAFGGDIFVRLLKCVGGQTETMLDFIHVTTQGLCSNRSDLFSGTKRMFLVFDEAQIAANSYLDCFPSISEPGDTRSLLHAAYRCFTGWNVFEGIIVSGTGLSRDIIQATFKSFSLKRLGKIYRNMVYFNTGNFLDKVSQENYIERYLGSPDSVSRQRLLQRMLHWFKGRLVCCYRYIIPRLGITS